MASTGLKFNWTLFCGQPDLIIWINEDFGSCFRHVFFDVFVYIAFAVCNAYYLGDRGLVYSRNARQLRLLNLRTLLTVLILLYPLGNLLGRWLIDRNTLYTSNYVSTGAQLFSWSLHLYFLCVLRKGISRSCRGPPSVVFGWTLTLFQTALLLRTCFLSSSFNPFLTQMAKLEKYMSYSQAVLQVFYLVTLIPKGEALELAWLSQRRMGSLVDEGNRPIVADSLTNSNSSLPPLNVGLGDGQNSNCLSRLFFSWVNPLLTRGCQKALTSVDDLFELPGRLKTTFIDTKFWIVYRDLQMRRSVAALRRNENTVPRQVSVLRALLATFGVEYFSLALLKLLNDGAEFAGPLILNLLVSYIDNPSGTSQSNDAYGYYLVLGLFGFSLFSSFVNVHYSFLLNNVGLKIRAALVTTIYRKTLHLKSAAMNEFSIGQVVNYMSTDADRVVNIFTSFHEFWSMPVKIGVCLFLLYQQVGVAYLGGVGFAVLLIPINQLIARAIITFNKTMMDKKDKRVKLMTEILFGIRAIKFYSWEEHLVKKINELRQAEVRSLKGVKYLDAFCVFFWAITPIIMAVLTFTTYTLLGHTLTVSNVFTCLALFNLLMVPLNAFPWVLGGVVQGWVSANRLQKIFTIEEVKLNKSYISLDETSKAALFIRNGEFTWTRSDPSFREAFQLKNINFEARSGQMVGIVGPVGCGKTTLLLGILSEIDRTDGEIGSTCVADGFAYVAQDPWIQNASIKENIMFGRPSHPEFYYQVVYACDLEEDFRSFPSGDETLVGERGITLSGGQKTRIALARAIYQDKDIYLIDDILSTLDSHVARHVMTHAVEFLLKKKTRILCTHHWRYLMKADHVILMKDGQLTDQGKPSVLLKDISVAVEPKTTRPGNTNKQLLAPAETDEASNLQGLPNVDSASPEEVSEQGALKWKVYKLYSSSVGFFITTLVLSFLFLMQASRNLSDWWLAHWMSSSSYSNLTHWRQNYGELKGNNLSDYQYYLTVYLIFAGVGAAFALGRAFLFAFGGIRAAVQLHSNILHTIMRATTKFFDVTPVGPIINRVSSDTYTVDEDLPFVLNILLSQCFGLAGAFVVICYSIPWLLLLLIPLGGIYMYVQHFYRHTSRELRRLEAVALSPIYAHFSESVLGLVTIRAFRYESKFKKENEERLERNQRAKFSLLVTSKWLSLRLQLIGVAVITGIGLFSVLEHYNHGIDPGLVGLAISYGLSITVTLSTVVQFCTETEKQMVSVERMLQYIEEVEPEKWEGFVKPHPSWPDEGVVAFHNVTLSYREQPALHNLTFATLPREKIGVVGRTGAGKSSLFSAIFRLVELEQGGITIDGLIIAYLDLKDLRSNIAIIPQDPFLFSGTIRNNLDPSNQFSDEEILSALDLCHMGDTVRTRYGGLDAVLAERGCDLSSGQRQLLCLARAVLSKAKILCIDEATANIDHETDRLVQKTIRSVFQDSTVITIAHRLETILDNDRILVMDQGYLSEFDTPQALLSNPNSLFYHLVHQHEWI